MVEPTDENWCFSGVKGTPFQMKLVFKTDIFLVTLTTKIFVFELMQDDYELETDYFGADLQYFLMCLVMLPFLIILLQCGHGVGIDSLALIFSLFSA